ncbi:MAG: hypothetical protein GX171_03705, partial [Clostridiales bacterium]|nr:hypothetical protein [Clostridiales bacterium]
KEGCTFTLWKNALMRVKGPYLNEKIVQLLLTQGSVKGSSGTLNREGQSFSFTPTGQAQPAATVPFSYQRAEKAGAAKAPSASKKPAGRKPKP